MFAVLQRVSQSQVHIDHELVASIEQGLMVLVGIEKHDQEQQMDKFIHKVLNYRIFVDDEDKMNLNLQQINGGLLLVPQFTLAADTNKGLRPSFSQCETPAIARLKFAQLVDKLRHKYPHTQAGRFGKDMKVSLINDGPVTFTFQFS
ncbi:MAG: D-tyrosyl-tRNA(Tyr) deacylase [Gammaproteobacteria bacterium]|nr:D-tyrosyl-tRNA(Tyr) deacylase [Gammaproteobacteria bacterium]